MRTFLLLAGLAGLGGALAAAPVEPPDALVIRPGGSGAAPVSPEQLYPDRPGFIVIRPRHAGDPKSLVPAETGTPVIRIIRGPGGQPPAPPDAPPQPPAAKQQPAGNEKDGKVVYEAWDAAYLRGQKVGHFHTRVVEYERDGKKLLYATKRQELVVARFGQEVRQWAEDTTMETPGGAVLTTRMSQGIGRDQMLSLSGKVSGRTLSVTIEGAAGGTQQVPWPDGVVGIAREATILKDHKPKPGDSFGYLYYEGRLNRVVRFTAEVRDVEEVPLVEGQRPRKLLKVVVAMEPIGQFRLPPSTVWADAETFEPLKMESDMPTLGGKMVVLRTSKEAALRPPGKLIELFDVQSIRLDREVPRIHDMAAVVYRVKLDSDLPGDKLFAQDDRQVVKNADPAAKTFELHVAAGRPPVAAPNDPAPAGKEFLAPSFFIDWDNDLVKQHARQAVAGLPATAGTWDKARAVEAWVNRNMRATEFSQAMATCANVAKTLSGDCTEYAMLTAGMCRALGIPSRTALGLVYAPSRDGKPFMAYHMWAEVYVEGQWVGLDATLGRGGIGPGHVKITDASWHEEKSFAPLLPVLTVLGARPKFEVLRVTEARR